MQASCRVSLDLAVERSWTPILSKEWDGDDLTKSVHLKSTAAHGANDWCVVDHVDLDALFHAAKIEISMRRSTERISHHEEWYCLSLCFFYHLSTATLDEISIGDHDFFTEKFLQSFIWDHQDSGVHLQVYLFGGLHSFHAFDWDVFLIAEAEANHMKYHSGIIKVF